MTACPRCGASFDHPNARYCAPCRPLVRLESKRESNRRVRARNRQTRPPTQKPCAYQKCQIPFTLSHPAQRYCSPECYRARNREQDARRRNRRIYRQVMARHAGESI